MFNVNSLDTIISSFTKTCKQLETLIENNKKKIEDNNSLILQYEESNLVRDSENIRASAIRSKLENLLSI